MKGVLLAGGKATRLRPSTLVLSKQLLPVYDKPMIYYSLSTLIHAGCSEVLLISSVVDLPSFQRLLGDGSQFGLQIHYSEQSEPKGVAQGIQIAEKFIGSESFCFILGDNLFHGPSFGLDLKFFAGRPGCHAFAYHVNNPQDYGVAVFNPATDSLLSLVEKPQDLISNWAIPGLYFFDNSAIQRSKELVPSPRGELEILDILKSYFISRELTVEKISRGNAWLDLGTPNNLLRASEFVQIIQERQGMLVGSPEEAAYKSKLIDLIQLQDYLNFLENPSYTSLVLGSLNQVMDAK